MILAHFPQFRWFVALSGKIGGIGGERLFKLLQLVSSLDHGAEPDGLRGDSEWLQQLGDLPLRDLLAVPKLNPKFIACPSQFVCQFLRGNLRDTLRLENLLDVVKEKDPDLLY